RVGRDARSHQRHRLLLRTTDRLDHPLLLGGRRTDHDGPGRVTVVTTRPCAEIHDDQIARIDDAVRGAAVRERAALAGRDDGFERWAIGAELAKGLLQEERHIALAYSGTNRLANPIEGPPGNAGDGAEQSNFIPGLHDAKLFDHPTGGDEQRSVPQTATQPLV